MPGSLTYVKDRHTPIVANPREVYNEGVKNIVAVLNWAKTDPETSQHFIRPRMLKIFEDEIVEPPDMPCADVVFVEEQETSYGDIGGGPSLGIQGVKEVWTLIYAVRYFHDYVDRKVRSKDVQRNLYAIRDVLKYRNDLNGWVKNLRSRIVGVNHEDILFGEGRNAGFIKGGAIVLKAFYEAKYNYYPHPRGVAFVSGGRDFE